MAKPGSPREQRQGRGDAAGERRDLRPVMLALVAVVLVGGAVKALAPVLMPLAAAILIALAVMPVRDRVAALVPAKLSWLGIVAALGVVLLALGLVLSVIAVAARQIASQSPVGAAEVVEMIQGGPGGAEGGTGGQSVAEGARAGAQAAQEDGGGAGEPGPAVRQGAGEGASGGGEGASGGQSPEGGEGSGSGEGASGGEGSGGGNLLSGSAVETLRSLADRALGAAGGAAAALLNSALALVAGLILVVFLTLLILSESGDWRRKVVEALPWPDDWRLRESADVIAQKMRAYLLIQAGIGLFSAMLYAAWLGFWGVGLLVVWTTLIFVLNFIPTVGSLVGGTLPVVYALLTKDLGTAVAVGAGIVVIENVMGNVVGPRVQGRNVALSPLVVLMSLVFWGWAWGVAGALLAVPLTVALVVVGAHIPVLRPWALLLSNRTEWAGLDEATRPDPG